MIHEHASLNAALGYAAVSGKPVATTAHADAGTFNYGGALHTAADTCGFSNRPIKNGILSRAVRCTSRRRANSRVRHPGDAGTGNRSRAHDRPQADRRGESVRRHVDERPQPRDGPGAGQTVRTPRAAGCELGLQGVSLFSEASSALSRGLPVERG
jgi:hypothetical protein